MTAHSNNGVKNILKRYTAQLVIAVSLLLVLIGARFYQYNYTLIDKYEVARYKGVVGQPNLPVSFGGINKISEIESRELMIECQFLLTQPAEIEVNDMRYLNLFQTAEAGEGLRLEFSINPQGVGVWGLVYNDKNKVATGVPFRSFPSYNDWHDLKILVSGKKIRVKLDKIIIADIVADNLTYATDNNAVGTGYSNARAFIGEIRNYKIRSYRLVPHLRDLTDIYERVLLLALLAYFVFKFNVIHRKMNVAWWSYARIASYAFLIIIHALIESVFTNFSIIEFVSSALIAFTMINLIALFGVLFGRASSVLNYLYSAIITVALVPIYTGFLFLLFYKLHLDQEFSMLNDLLTFDEIGAVYQSSPGEAFEYLLGLLLPYELICICIFCVICTIAILYTSLGETKSSRVTYVYVSLLALQLIVSCNLILSRSNLHGVLWITISEVLARKSEFQLFVNYRNDPKKKLALASVKKNGKGETYVVVIGESASRMHMGSYGYFRETTPWLSSKKDEPQALLFNNAYASYCHTIPSLLMALTGANQYNGADPFSTSSIINVFKSAGFKTFWFSEQGVSWLDSPLNALAAESDVVKFVKPLGSLIDIVDESIRKLNKDENNLIIVHLLGSHAPYVKRYPRDYKVDYVRKGIDLKYLNQSRADFVDAVLNPYDASIHYTDHRLSKIHNSLIANGSKLNALVYFSDHGEDVMGETAHNASLFNFSMVRIPFAVIVSDEWRKANQEKFSRLKEHRGHVFTLDLFFEFMIGMANISTQLVDLKYDFTSNDYAININNALTMSNLSSLQKNLYIPTKSFDLSQDPWLITNENISYLKALYGDKFLGVNADMPMAPAKALKFGLSGVEINVKVPDMTIGHYPERTTNMSLDTYLHESPFAVFKKIWFDSKLMSGRSLLDCLGFFEAIDLKHKVKDRSIFESWEDGLAAFSNTGWNTSYYIHEIIWPDINSKQDDVLRKVAKDIAARVASQNARGISFFAKDYDFVKLYVEPLMPPDVVYHTWSLSIPPINTREFRDQVKGNKIMADPRVVTILLECLNVY